MPAPTPISSSALEASHIVRSGPCSFKSLLVNNTGAAQYIQLHNSATLPAEGAVPVARFSIEATTERTFVFPMFFSLGLVICNSSAIGTKTIGSADCYFTVTLK